MFTIPEHVRPLRDRVLRFVEDRVQPREGELDRPWPESVGTLKELHAEAKSEGLWALGHPAEIGGGGMPMRDYLYISLGGNRRGTGHRPRDCRAPGARRCQRYGV